MIGAELDFHADIPAGQVWSPDEIREQLPLYWNVGYRDGEWINGGELTYSEQLMPENGQYPSAKFEVSITLSRSSRRNTEKISSDSSTSEFEAHTTRGFTDTCV